MKRPQKKKKSSVFVKKLLGAQLQNGDFFKMELTFYIGLLKKIQLQEAAIAFQAPMLIHHCS